MSKTTQYRALKKIIVNTPNHTGSVEVGEKTLNCRSSTHHKLRFEFEKETPPVIMVELEWKNYKGEFDLEEAIKNGWIEEVVEEPEKVMEFHENGSCKNRPEDGTEYFYVDTDFKVESQDWNDDGLDLFYLGTLNCFLDEEKAKLFSGLLKYNAYKIK